MSVPSLLRYVGIDVPRGVTIDGRVIFGSAATAAIVAGRATPVAHHTNHGGLADADAPTRSAWWIDEPAVRASDVAAVQEAFPGFVHDASEGGHRFEGVIDTGRGRFRVAVSARPDRSLPWAIPVEPRAMGRYDGGRFVRPDHLFTNGALCVASEEDWDHELHTTATVIAWAAHWYATYTDWRLGGPWPTEGFHPRV